MATRPLESMCSRSYLLAAVCLTFGCGSEPATLADAACIARDGSCEEVRCPPGGPYGYEIDDTLLNVTFRDCDDNPVDLHSLCGARVGMVVNVYTWCAGCFDNAVLASSLYETHAAAGLSTIVVVSEDAYEEPATAELCREVKDHYQLSGTVAYDDSGAMEAYGTTDLVLLTDPAASIYFKRRGATEETIVQAVEAGLD